MRYITPEQITADQQEAAKWAHDLLKQDFLILDSETTGFGKAEAVEIAIVNQSGRTVFASLIKPTILIPVKVTGIHGISDADVAKSPSHQEIAPVINRLIEDAHLCIYNHTFDMGILQYCSSLHGVPMIDPKLVHCVMRQYAKFKGEWDASKGDYRWHKLTGGDHTAVGDCHATLKLIREMADGWLGVTVDGSEDETEAF